MHTELKSTSLLNYPNMAIALVHYPILDRAQKVVATNITNFDVHDIARAAKVYGIKKYYIIHPIPEQLMFVDRILDHWRTGEGSVLNPKRKTALTDVYTAPDLATVQRDFTPEMIVATHARRVDGTKPLSFHELRSALWEKQKKTLLLFGTGFGLTHDFMRSCDYLLDPIEGAPPQDYRHLSVRSAVSICLDRLLGTW